MISQRRYLEALLHAEEKRTNILFSIASAIGIFVYYELGRRQKVNETREEARRTWVDSKISDLDNITLGHRERSEQISRFGKMLVSIATIAVGVVALHQVGWI